MMSEFNAKSGDALDDLVTNQGVKLREFNDDVYDSFGEAAVEVEAEARSHSDLAERIFASHNAARADVGNWMKLADVSYSLKRNRVLDL